MSKVIEEAFVVEVFLPTLLLGYSLKGMKEYVEEFVNEGFLKSSFGRLELCELDLSGVVRVVYLTFRPSGSRVDVEKDNLYIPVFKPQSSFPELEVTKDVSFVQHIGP